MHMTVLCLNTTIKLYLIKILKPSPLQLQKTYISEAFQKLMYVLSNNIISPQYRRGHWVIRYYTDYLLIF